MTETTVAAPPWSAEVERFVVAHGLRADLLLALELVARAFGPRADITPQMQFFPEEGERRVLVGIVANTDFDTAVACREVLADSWTRELPLRAQDQMVFTYTTA
jgi:hypothetical protein